jgi:hypothetical protein
VAASDRVAAGDRRFRILQRVGILSGFTAGAWLGGAEAPTWGAVFFNELRGAGPGARLGVVGGALVMFGGATLVAIASAGEPPAAHPFRGAAAALTAGVLWGTMYIRYREAYVTGMSPLSFVTFFTVGELGMMSALAFGYAGGAGPLWRELASARGVLFLAAVRGDRPAIVALSTASGGERSRWQEAARRERERYQVQPGYGRTPTKECATSAVAAEPARRTWVDWLVVGAATAGFVAFGAVARRPGLPFDGGWVALLVGAMLALPVVCGRALWRTTRFE